MESLQYWTEASPCPICGGHQNLPRGEGVRCHGYRGPGTIVFCARKEHAGDLQLDKNNVYQHTLSGFCGCGVSHHPGRDRPRPQGPPKGDLSAVYPYKQPGGTVLFEVLRYQQPNGKKDFRQRRPNGQGGYVDNIRGITPILYHLDALVAADPATPVLVVEGEKDADLLIKEGFLATCNPMGAGHWEDHYAKALQGRPVRILPDHDEVGEKHATEVGRSLHALASSVKMILLDDLPDHGDVSDWFERGHTAAKLRKILEDTPDWEPPIDWEPSIPFTLMRRPRFPVAVLPPWLRAYVDAIATALEVPVDLVAMATLSVLSAVIAGRFSVLVEADWTELVVLWCVIIAESGEKKSPVMAAAMAPIKHWEYERNKDVETQARKKKEEKALYDQTITDLRKKHGKAESVEDREVIQAEVMQFAEKSEGVKTPVDEILTVGDATTEQIVTAMYEQGGRISAMCDESPLFAHVDGRYSQNPMVEPLMQGYSGFMVDVRRGDRQQRIPAPVFGMGITLQPSVLREMKRVAELRGRGFFARICWAYPESMVGRCTHTTPGAKEETKKLYYDNIMRLLEARPGNEDAREQRKEIALAPAAHTLLTRYQQDMEPLLCRDKILRGYADWAKKLAGNVVRIAALLHVADHPKDGARWAYPISEDTMARAIQIGQYLVPHMRLALRELGADLDIGDAEYVLDWIRSGQGRRRVDRFTRTEAYRSLQHRFTSAALEPVLAKLVAHNRIQPLEHKAGDQKGTKGGRPPLVYMINPDTQPALCMAQGPSRAEANEQELQAFLDRWSGSPPPPEEVNAVFAVFAQAPETEKNLEEDDDAEDEVEVI